MQKKPILVAFFEISLLYLPAKCVYRFFKAYKTPFWHDITDLSAIYSSLYSHPLIAVLQFSIPLIIVAGLFMGKKWGYYLLMFFSSAYLLRLLYFVFETTMHFSQLGAGRYILLGTLIPKACYFLAMICYFSRPKVRELFK